MPVGRRAPAPTLPIEYLRSSPSLPTSSPISSPFLTPPISEPLRDSPPPRPEDVDYITAKSRHGQRRKHPMSHPRRLHNTREGNTTLSDSQVHTKDSARNESSKCKSYDAAEPVGNMDHVFDAILRRSPDEISPGEQSHHPQPDSRSFHANESAKGSAKSRITSPTDTPAVCALRRLSEATKPAPGPLPQYIRRMSNAIVPAFGLTETQDTPPPRKTSEGPMARERTDSSLLDRRKDQSPANSGMSGWEFARSLGIPTQINLRKASKAEQNPIASETQSNVGSKKDGAKEEDVRISPPAVELVAFYSEHKQPVDNMPSVARASTFTKIGQGPGPNIQPKNPEILRRQSCAAEVAITYADVHIAPGTFLVSSNAREHLLRSETLTQRVSAVQLRSSNSVHEIIWREDESGSGSSISCSSQGSSSPLRATQFPTIGGSGLENDAFPVHALKAPSDQGSHIPFLTKGTGPEESQSRENLSSTSLAENDSTARLLK